MPNRLKRSGFIGLLAVIVVEGIIIWRGIQTVGSLPISLRYVGNGSFPNGLSFDNFPGSAAFVRSGPTFAITNHTSQSQDVGWYVEVRNGPIWIRDRSISGHHTMSLAPNTGAYVIIDFVSQIPTNTWRLTGSTEEPLRGPASAVAALRDRSVVIALGEAPAILSRNREASQLTTQT